MISGKPVKSSIGRTSSPASRSVAAVPPVETSSTPSSASPRANSTMLVLSDTDRTARRTRTSPGCVMAVIAGGPYRSDLRQQDAPGLRRVDPHDAAGDEPHGLREQLVLHGPQRRADLLHLGRHRQLHGALEDDRAAVDALVDEVHGDP